MAHQSRDDFPADVIRSAKMRAAYICANPNCRTFTIAPSTVDDLLVQYRGKVAHITAASKGGPRYEEQMTPGERMSISNAIFLCSNCADLIDKNYGIDYPVSTLHLWKEGHYTWVLTHLNKTPNEGNNVSVSSSQQSGGITANTVNFNTSPAFAVDETKRHDLATYLRLEAIIDEDFVHRFYDDLEGNAVCKVDDMHLLDKIHLLLRKTSNSFINDKLDATRITLLNSIPPLSDFVGVHFDKWPYDQESNNFDIQLHPDYIRDTRYKPMKWEDREKWTALFDELKKLNLVFHEAYCSFRKAIKQVLHQ